MTKANNTVAKTEAKPANLANFEKAISTGCRAGVFWCTDRSRLCCVAHGRGQCQAVLRAVLLALALLSPHLVRSNRVYYDGSETEYMFEIPNDAELFGRHQLSSKAGEWENWVD